MDQGRKEDGKPLADVIYLDPMFPHKKKVRFGEERNARHFNNCLGDDVRQARNC